MKLPVKSVLFWQITFVAVLLVLVFIVYGFGALLLLGSGLFESPIPQVTVLSPGAGAFVLVGQTVRVEAEAGGSPILAFELWDNNQRVMATEDVRARDDVWSFAQEWRANNAGVHRLSVRAIDMSQRIAISQPITVFVAPRGQITYASNRAVGYRIYTMLANGEGITTVAVNEQDHREPSWSARSGLAFITLEGQGNAHIWLSRGQNFEKLTTAPAPRSHPSLSPQADTLAYVESRQGIGGLYVWDFNGGSPRLIVSGFDDIAQPTWSPDGRQIAFMGNNRRNADIYVVNRDGTNIRRLMNDAAQDWQPAWSPAGAGIAFVSNRGGSHQIYVMRADGTGQTQLTDFASGAEQPAWSPDSLWLAFVAYTGLGPRLDAREIYLMRSDGADQMRVTNNAFDDTEPVWAP